MTTENLQEGIEVTPQAFADLQKRLVKVEKKLDKAKSRAQQTMQEIWQLDLKLKEEEERANLAEAKLAALETEDVQLAAEDTAVVSELRDEIEQLRDELKRARESAAEVGELRERLSELQEELARRPEPEDLLPLEELRQRAAQLAEEKATLEARISELEALEREGSAGVDEELDAELRAAQERISELEDSLASSASVTPALDGDSALELMQARLDGLRIALHEAEERAVEAESKISVVDGSASVFQSQLEEIQLKVKEAEERALDWEERFHRSEERASRAEQIAEGGGASSELAFELQDRVFELETELAELRQGASGEEGSDSSGELEELRRELTSAQDRLSELEGQGGVNLDEYQRLERELQEFQAELEDANKRANEAALRVEELESLSIDDKVAQYKERLELSEERSQLLQQKAQQAAEKLELANSRMDDLKQERERLNAELAEVSSSFERLKAKAEAETDQSQQVILSGAAVETRLQEALARARDAELKSNQSEIQLQKAMASLKEYEQRANESDRETQRLAFQDGLTGLPNINLVRQYLEFTVKQVQRYNRASALLAVDLDRFKLINDAMGFKAGDELLIKVAERLQTAIRESDALGRKGEDEFLILLSELITGDEDTPAEQKTNMIRQNIAIVVNRISECLSRPFNIQGQKFYIRASIGVSICPNDADSAQAMLEHADSAMYHAKDSGRGRCVFYNNELHKKQERRLTMDSQLRLAMEKGEFVLQYQPIIEVTKGRGTVVGVEALLRWNHRIDGLLEPAAFLNIAEETGLIVQLGQWVCRQSCWQLRQWLSQGHNLFVSFNVSTRQMLQADLAEMIMASVEEFGLPPGLVFVELSEGSNVEEVDLLERVITNLGRAGIRVAIDDFGIGYSSISRIDLKHIQFLKVDPSLVRNCHDDKTKANICEATVKLAQSLELIPVAEGVETAAQAKFLQKAGCRFMQGYHIHKPANAEVITALLVEKRGWKF